MKGCLRRNTLILARTIVDDVLPNPLSYISEPLRLFTHARGTSIVCVPTSQRGADGTMWLEYEHMQCEVAQEGG